MKTHHNQQNKKIIVHTDTIKEFFICAGNNCEVLKDDERIKNYYSYLHAKKRGWHFTKDIMFSKDGDLVAVCKDCWESK
jgi:hypothetical protein